MYGIQNFDEKVEKAIADGLVEEHMPTEEQIETISWSKERAELMPKLWRHRKFVYQPDRLSEFLVFQQERAQAFNSRLKDRFKRLNSGYSYLLQRLEERLEDRDLVPTIGLSSLAGIVSWGSNSGHSLPIKIILAGGGALLSAALTHRRLRDSLLDRTSQAVPVEVKQQLDSIDREIGSLGARAWCNFDHVFDGLKVKLKNKLT